MATYKVPQDVEADDKLLGPFTFRQFIYLMIIFGLILVAIFLVQIHVILVVIPIPFIFFFGILALPIKKDQPMETYLAAVVSFYTKPNKRFWIPGQSESTILISAPKVTEDVRARNITGEEASTRLAFLTNLIDSEGHSIKNASTIMKDNFYAEAAGARDIFEETQRFQSVMTAESAAQRQATVDSMREAIADSDYNKQGQVNIPGEHVIAPREGFVGTSNMSAAGLDTNTSGYLSPSMVQPIFSAPTPAGAPVNDRGETITQEADRIAREQASEVIVPLKENTL